MPFVAIKYELFLSMLFVTMQVLFQVALLVSVPCNVIKLSVVTVLYKQMSMGLG